MLKVYSSACPMYGRRVNVSAGAGFYRRLTGWFKCDAPYYLCTIWTMLLLAMQPLQRSVETISRPSHSIMDIQSPPVAAKKRAPRSPLKCVIVTLAVFGLLVCIGVSYALYSGLRALLKNVNDPHRSLFPEKTPEHRDSGYVWPLIAENDKFDIVLGIWAREPDGDIDPEDVEEAHGDELAAEALTGMPMSEIRGPWKQRNLYEEVVFQSVGLQGKMLDREVHFKLPLDRL